MRHLALFFIFATRIAAAGCEEESAHRSELYFNLNEKSAWRIFQKSRSAGEHWYRRGAALAMDHGHGIAESVNKILWRSRGYARLEDFTPTPLQKRLLDEEKYYFEKGYLALFGKKPYYSMDDVTVLVNDPDESNLAGGVRKKTYVYRREPEKRFRVIVTHELIHLHSPGFRLDEIEEGMVEYIRWRIHRLSGRPETFHYVSETYNNWRLGLVEVFSKIPSLEMAFVRSFKNRKLRPLYASIRKHRSQLRSLIRSDESSRRCQIMAEYVIDALKRP